MYIQNKDRHYWDSCGWVFTTVLSNMYPSGLISGSIFGLEDDVIQPVTIKGMPVRLFVHWRWGLCANSCTHVCNSAVTSVTLWNPAAQPDRRDFQSALSQKPVLVILPFSVHISSGWVKRFRSGPAASTPCSPLLTHGAVQEAAIIQMTGLVYCCVEALDDNRTCPSCTVALSLTVLSVTNCTFKGP